MILEFDLELQTGSQNGGFVLVPINTKEVFGSARPKIKAVFNHQFEYRGTLAKYGSDLPMLIVLKDIREKLNLNSGDTVHVQIEEDTAPRTVEIPEELVNLMDERDLEYFKSLSYSVQKEHARYIAEAKKEETRINRAIKTLDTLRKR